MRWLMLAFLAVMVFMAWRHPDTLARDDAGARPTAVELPTTRRDPRAEAPVEAPRDAAAAGAGALPPEVHETLALIAAGGPFPFDRDGVVFGNYEHRLPHRERGWYREYTVPTPGLDHRGARRIVTGGEPPSEYWYTDDHYESFRRIDSGDRK
jgi:guanyl-specific ribonuclease Sa